jgi:putative endonuclease
VSLHTAIAARFIALESRAYTSLRTLADRRLATRAKRLGQKQKPPHLLTGERGEDAAFFHLRSLGYTVTARRWRAQRLPGDLDLVAWDGNTLVIFEIKTRTARDLAPAETQVDEPKRRVLRRMAASYLGQFPESDRRRIPLRFDVLSVYLNSEGPPEFEHFPDAFPRANPPRRHRPRW